MPGTFAHITMVYRAKASTRLGGPGGLSAEAHRAISGLTKYAELGAVSPDYPYLDLLHGDAKRWADKMHYERTGEMIREGARRVRAMAAGVPRRHCLAWLMGYAAHVVADVTIHPVVKLKVGAYEGHETEHRLCEMHQDAFIYETLNVGDITTAEQLRDGICSCGRDGAIDADVKALWDAMLRALHAGEIPGNPPNIDQWHRSFRLFVDHLAEEGEGWLPGFVMRRVAEKAIFFLPRSRVDTTFVEDLAVPGGGRMHYRDIFQKAADHVADMWLDISRAVEDGGEVASAKPWNLDEGIDLETGATTYWG